MERHGSRSQKGPYARKEGRKSFFSKMKDSFKDIMYPSWLSGSDKNEAPTSKTGVSADTPVNTSMGPSGVSSPDIRPFQGQFNPEVGPIPGLNMGLPNGQPHTLEFASLEPSKMESSFQSPNLPPPISEFTSSLLPLNRLTEKSDSVLANEDTMSQRSDASKSTSGCSSMVPQLDSSRRDSGTEKRKATDHESPGSKSRPSPGPQPTPKRQRLNASLSAAANRTWTQRFNDTMTCQQPSGNLKRPAFNTSLFGPAFTEDTSVLGTSFHESSFYPGKTTFGGRSSFRSTKKGKMDLNQSLPSRLSFPVKSFVKAKPKVTPIKEAVTSSRAKRILDVLDSMPTPLSDAKKIPVIVPHNFTMNPSFFSKEVASTNVGPPTRRQTIGGLASISKNRQTSTGTSYHTRDDSTVKPGTSSDFTSVSMHRDDTVRLGSDLQPTPSTSGKMRREKSYHRGSASIRPTLEEEETIVISPELRTDFTLPVASVPQFSFGTPNAQQTSSQKSATQSKPVGLNFTFSSPVAEKVSGNKPASPQKVGGFQFSSPTNLDKKDTFSNNFSNEPKSMPGFSSFSTLPKPKAKFNGPPTESSIGGFKPANELKTGSVMDILGGSSSAKSDVQKNSVAATGTTTTSSTIPLSALFKQTGWTCDTCLIKNKEEMSKCAACQSNKPVPKQQNGMPESVTSNLDMSNAGSSTTVPLSALFKQSGWSCDVCLLKNKDDAYKCVACQAPKPGPTKQTGSAANPVDKGLSNAPLSSMFKKSGWKCDVCLISNKDEVEKCVACQTPKPGPKTQTGQSSKPNLLSKNSVLPGNWVCNTCLIQNKSEDSVCGACKATKSASTSQNAPKKDDFMANFKTSSGNWKCEVCLIQNKPDANSCLACQSPKPLKCFRPPPGDWVCDTCLVNNKAKDVKCVACNYSRPGPPRTQAVPSGAKSFSMSQPSGFSFPNTSSSDSSKDTSNVAVLNVGGFRFGTGTSSNKEGVKFGATSSSEVTSKTSESGFKFGNAGSDTSKTLTTTGFKFETVNSKNSENGKLENVPSTVGFKFGSVNSSTDNKSTSDTTGQKADEQKHLPSTETGLGPVTSNNSVIAPTVGFKFGASAPKDNTATGSSTGGFQFGTATSVSSTPVGGFQFGISSSTTSSSPSATNSNVTSISVVSNSGVVSGQTLVDSSSDPVKTNSVTQGGLPTAGSTVNPLLNKTSQQPGSQGLGGFNSTSSGLKTTNSSIATSSSLTGFPFGGINTSEANSSKEMPKPVFGGFPAQSSAPSSTPAFGGFAFAQKKDDSQNTGSAVANYSDISSTKRSRDEDSGETTVNKSNFSFGSNASSTPFQFGGSKTDNKPQSNASPFVFGQQNTTTTTTQTGGFNFSMNKPNDTSKPLFGAATSEKQTNNAAPVFGNTNSAFSFTGQKSEPTANKPVASTGLFGNFGGSTAPSTTPTAPTFNFGGSTTNTTTFGSSTGSAFGGNAPSTTPAFGATPPSVFGSTNTAAVTTTTPAFGAGVFQFGSDKTSGSSQPPQTTNAVFQFGSKPADNAQPTPANQGFNFNATQAGLGGGTPNFNFSQSAAPGTFAFSPAPAPGTGERKIKRAVRKLRR